MTWKMLRIWAICCAMTAVLMMWACGGSDSVAPVNCGDGFVDTPADMESFWCSDADGADCEDCDDGNTEDGDGCSATCAVESGWTCVTMNGGPTECTQD